MMQDDPIRKSINAGCSHWRYVLMATTCLFPPELTFLLPAAPRHPFLDAPSANTLIVNLLGRHSTGSRRVMTFSTKRSDICSATAKYSLALAVTFLEHRILCIKIHRFVKASA
jgi:hypothetical protein